MSECQMTLYGLIEHLRLVDPASADAVREIVIERLRQVEVEGWTIEHDDKHDKGELSRAAMGYVQSGSLDTNDTSFLASTPPRYWPWDRKWWKPMSPRRDLIRAAALVAADIARLDRRENRT